jgi:hypothetical protein
MVFNASFNNISDIVAFSFINRGNQSVRWKTLTCRKSLRNFITLSHNIVSNPIRMWYLLDMVFWLDVYCTQIFYDREAWNWCIIISSFYICTYVIVVCFTFISEPPKRKTIDLENELIYKKWKVQMTQLNNYKENFTMDKWKSTKSQSQTTIYKTYI